MPPSAANRLGTPVPHFLPYGQKTGASVADFRVRRREMMLIVNSDDMRVRIYTSQPANVRAFGACTAAGCNPLKKMALPSF